MAARLTVTLIHANNWDRMYDVSGAAIRFSDAGDCTSILPAVSR